MTSEISAAQLPGFSPLWRSLEEQTAHTLAVLPKVTQMTFSWLWWLLFFRGWRIQWSIVPEVSEAVVSPGGQSVPLS